jgi:SpoU rRNA methylase family enzyme
MVHAGRPPAGAGIPAARGPQRHGAVPGEKSEGPLAVVDELDAAVAVLEPEKVRLRVEPVDAG